MWISLAALLSLHVMTQEDQGRVLILTIPLSQPIFFFKDAVKSFINVVLPAYCDFVFSWLWNQTELS